MVNQFTLIAITLIAIILQFIGLMRENHVMLIPYIVTTSMRIALVAFGQFLVWLIAGGGIFKSFTSYAIMSYVLIHAYCIVLNIVVYKQFSLKKSKLKQRIE